MSNDPKQQSTVDKSKVRDVSPGDKDEQKQADVEDRVAQREGSVDDVLSSTRTQAR